MYVSFEHLWQYNTWANRLLIETLNARKEPIPTTCLRLLSHIVNAQTIWAGRVSGIEAAVGVWQVHELPACERYHELSSEVLRKVVENPEAREDQLVHYTNTQHVHFENALSGILLHVFNHGTYHRAQIAMEMRKHGLEPINTDYITYIRHSGERGV